MLMRQWEGGSLAGGEGGLERLLSISAAWTLRLPNCSHQFQCVAPSSLLPLTPLPLSITPDLTLPKVNHHPSPLPRPWTIPFLTEALYSPGSRAEF